MHDFQWQWSAIGEAGPVLVNGAVVSLLLALFAAATGSVLGTVLGVAMSGTSLGARIAALPVRAIAAGLHAAPVMVVLVAVHEAMPRASAPIQSLLSGVQTTLAPTAGPAETTILGTLSTGPFATALAVLAVIVSARIAVIVRNGVRGVQGDMIDAARSQGMGRMLLLRRVIVPETMRTTAPAVISAYVTTLMLTTLAALIGCGEIVSSALAASRSTGRPVEVWTVVLAGFLVVIVPAHWIIRRLAGHDPASAVEERIA